MFGRLLAIGLLRGGDQFGLVVVLAIMVIICAALRRKIVRAAFYVLFKVVHAVINIAAAETQSAAVRTFVTHFCSVGENT
jgi:hypothetical protein